MHICLMLSKIIINGNILKNEKFIIEILVFETIIRGSISSNRNTHYAVNNIFDCEVIVKQQY